MWEKREEQLRGVLDSTAGLYGDLQGIAGRAMQDIESLEVLMIEDRARRRIRRIITESSAHRLPVTENGYEMKVAEGVSSQN
jgi:hypothetical protein